MINHDGDSLYCGNYESDVFNTNTGIWWQCADNNITQMSDIRKGRYIREIHKKKKKKKSDVRINRCIICCIYQNKPYDKLWLHFFNNSPTCPK